MKLLENRKFHLVLNIVFTLVALVWVLMSHPRFPILCLFQAHIPFFRFPVLGFIVPCWLLYFHYKKLAAISLLLVVPFFMAYNLNMLRPDFYLLWLLLFILSLSQNKEQFYYSFLLVLFGMYFYTAIQKMHGDFFTGMARVFDKRILSENLPQGSSHILAISIPIVEMLLAVLCLSPYRKGRMMIGIIVHVCILYFIIVGGWNYGMAVWNISLLILHILLPAFDWKKLAENKSWALIPSIVSLLLPLLFMIGVGPVFSSWNMYSAKTVPYRLKIDVHTAQNPPDCIRDFVYSKDGEYSVSINEWADKETGGAPCMEPIFAGKLMLECDQYIHAYQ